MKAAAVVVTQTSTDDADGAEAALSHRLAMLDAVTSALSEVTDLSGLLDRTLTTAMEITGVSGGGIFLFDDRSEDLRLIVHRGVSERFAQSFIDVPSVTLHRLATDPNAQLITRNLADTGTHRKELLEEGIRAYAGIPLQAGGRPLGVLVVVSYSQSDFNAADVDLLVTIGKLIGFAIERAQIHDASQGSLRRMQAFQTVATAITESLDLATTLERVLDAAMDVFEADRAALFLVRESDQGMLCPAARNLSAAYIEDVIAHYATLPWPAVLDTRRSVYVEDAQQTPPTPALVEQIRREGIRSMLFLPLRGGDERLGMLVLYHDQVRHYTRAETNLARTYADQATIAIRHARLFEAERRAREQSTTILDATRAVTATLRFEDVLREAGRWITRVLRQPLCGVWLVSDDGTRLVPAFRVALQPDAERDAHFQSLPPLVIAEIPRIRVLLHDREPLVIRSTDTVSDQVRAIQRLLPYDAYVAVPLAAGDRVVGVVTVPLIVGDGTVAADDLEVAMAVARSTALAVDNARLHEQARQLAVVEERNRLARELHDSVSHSLFSMSLISQALPVLLDRDESRARERIDRLNELGRGALAEMRALIFELRPAALEEQGLAVALAKHTAAFESREGVAVDLQIAGERRLPAAIEEAVFRVAQEALNNVAKHARATRVSLDLTIEDDVVELVVQDDGCGFDPAERPAGRRTLGLTSMQERAALLGGVCVLESAVGQGTTIRLRLPVG